jgi:hypothetical protein
VNGDVHRWRRRSVVSALAAIGLALVAPPASAQLQCHVGTIAFYPAGGIKSCEIEGDHQFSTAQGLPLKCRSGHPVSQYPGGRIESCAIAEPHRFGDVHCAAPGRVELNPDGSLRRCDGNP